VARVGHAREEPRLPLLTDTSLFIGFPLVFLLRRGTPSGDVEMHVD
jgi:hypothetical protein